MKLSFQPQSGRGRAWSSLLPLLVALVLFTQPAMAADEDEPTAMAMTGDMLIGRPAGVVITAVGAAAFVLTLPFSAAGGNMKQAAEQLVVGPAKATFVRCLGCTTSGRYQDPDE